jgi:hypothetical protein
MLCGKIYKDKSIAGDMKYALFSCSLMLVILLLVACNTTINDCDTNVHGDYEPGELLVSFNDEITQEEAEELLNTYNDIEIDNAFGNRASYVVKVEEGTEGEWICTLQQEAIIKHVEVSYFMYDDNF